MNDSDSNLNKFIIFDVMNEFSSKMTNDVIDNHPHTFILIRMDKCGPCEATVPEWKKMCEVIEKKYSENSDIALINFEQSFLSNLNNIGKVEGFPTIKYINRKKNIIEPYEDSAIEVKDRSSKSFINWINSKVSETIDDMKGGDGGMYELAKKISLKQKNSAKAYDHDPNNDISIEQLFINKTTTKRNKKNKNVNKKKSFKNKKKTKKYNKKRTKKYNKKRTKKYNRK